MRTLALAFLAGALLAIAAAPADAAFTSCRPIAKRITWLFGDAYGATGPTPRSFLAAHI
jgi:hypothetical protein